MQVEDDQWLCPSFNSYSSNKLADIAAKVSDEVNGDVKVNEESLQSIVENDEEDDEFEFSLVRNDLDAEVFCDGQVRPVFPIFNRHLLDDLDQRNREGENENCDTITIPSTKIFTEEREPPPSSSSSSSEDDELDSVPPGTYCVWRPKLVEPPSQSTCQKSKSTGSASKRSWKLRDLLRRSNSEGKDSFMFLTAKKKEEKAEKRKISNGKSKASPSGSPLPSPWSSPAHEAYYARNRAAKGNETPKRKSYLPYRQDLVGFFTTVNSLGRTLPRF